MSYSQGLWQVQAEQGYPIEGCGIEGRVLDPISWLSSILYNGVSAYASRRCPATVPEVHKIDLKGVDCLAVKLRADHVRIACSVGVIVVKEV